MPSGCGSWHSMMPTCGTRCMSIWRSGNLSQCRRANRSRLRKGVRTLSRKVCRPRRSRNGLSKLRPKYESGRAAARRSRTMSDLSTTYLGLKLRTPLVASASPLSHEPDGIRRLEDAGASAVVLYSLFEEQLRNENLELEHSLTAGTESFAESQTFFPQSLEFYTGPEEYLTHIAKVRKAAKIPIIASLNGATLGGWTDYARRIEEAGADAIECNIYFIPTNPHASSQDIESLYQIGRAHV